MDSRKEKIKYPKLHYSLDRRKKFSPQEIKKMISMKNQFSMSYIAVLFGCHKSTVKYWIDSEYRERKNKIRASDIKERLTNDSEYKKICNEQHYESIKYRKKVNPLYKKYRQQKYDEFIERNKTTT